MHLIFDVETTGLPPKKSNWEFDYMSFPYIVQLSWMFVVNSSKTINNFIIKPEGYEIPKDVSELHGITTEIALEKGVPFKEVISFFINDCVKSNYIIGHNIYFDTSLIKANVLRMIKQSGVNDTQFIELVKNSLHKSKRVDTMRNSVNFCKIKHPDRAGYKWPKLTELYYVLFSENFEESHNAKNDVIATDKCFDKLCELGVITL